MIALNIALTHLILASQSHLVPEYSASQWRHSRSSTIPVFPGQHYRVDITVLPWSAVVKFSPLRQSVNAFPKDSTGSLALVFINLAFIQSFQSSGIADLRICVKDRSLWADFASAASACSHSFEPVFEPSINSIGLLVRRFLEPVVGVRLWPLLEMLRQVLSDVCPWNVAIMLVVPFSNLVNKQWWTTF